MASLIFDCTLSCHFKIVHLSIDNQVFSQIKLYTCCTGAIFPFAPDLMNYSELVI